MSAISNLSNTSLQSIITNASQGTGLYRLPGPPQVAAKLTVNPDENSLSGVSTSSGATQADNQQLSPFAQLASTLQQLQQSDPTQYKQVTQEIATNLKNASQTASADGNQTAATQLNQLANDFTTASQNGQLPNLQDLAQAVTGSSGHHSHHHHVQPVPADADGDASSNSSSGLPIAAFSVATSPTTAPSASGSSTLTSTANQALNQLLSTLQANGTQNDSLNPLNIILNTLSGAGITTTS